MTLTLPVQKRAKGERPEKSVLGVVYGPKQEPVPLSIDKPTFEKTLNEAGESTVIVLTGLDEELEVLIHDVTFDPTKGGAQHVDFYAFERGKELTTHVNLEFHGEAPVEKTGATVNKILYSVEITCRPSALPSHIDVDLSKMVDEESEIRVKDLPVPPEVTIENDPEDVVANVSAAREEEPEEVPEEVDMEAVEVEGKGKEEGEESADDTEVASEEETKE